MSGRLVNDARGDPRDQVCQGARDPYVPGNNGSALTVHTHFCGRSQKGNWVVQRKTSRSRFGRALQRVTDWCRKGRHLSVSEQHKTLVAKVRGHYSYFGKHSAEENA